MIEMFVFPMQHLFAPDFDARRDCGCDRRRARCGIGSKK